MSSQDLHMKGNNIVSKSNTLIEANSRLNLIEQKIILCLASNIEPCDRDFKTYTFSVKHFQNLLGLNGSAKYTELSKITKELLSRVIEIRRGEELIQLSWLSSAIYNRNRGTIDIRFDPLLKPFLLELSSKFTSYRLVNVIQLKSTYAIRIYELLKQYEHLKERTISLENLRYFLDAIDVYPNYANFKQRVLKPSQKELNAKTDISFEFDEVKSGRKVEKIRFIIGSQKRKGIDLIHFERNLKQTHHTDKFEQIIKRFEESCNEKINLKVLKKWKEHEDVVLDIIDSIRFRSDINTPIGYVEYMLNSNLKEHVNIQTDRPVILSNKNMQDTIPSQIKIIFDEVIRKYSLSTGTLATFIVKDTVIERLLSITTYEEAENIWNRNETYVMDKIYECIKKNQRKKR